MGDDVDASVEAIQDETIHAGPSCWIFQAAPEEVQWRALKDEENLEDECEEKHEGNEAPDQVSALSGNREDPLIEEED